MTVVARTSLELLRYEIEHGTQRSVAVMYAVSMRALVNTEVCRPINEAITERWSMRGLERVKKMAWEIHEAMCQDAEAA